ncbi:alpha-tocopherol transfer protein-like [Euwallacea fornicatus]|uniref:alpha-tocopherol transfer protein-like n=1 Tax=Euwallacea fornicatus TaxID=995702 RepID=UPI00338D62AF
MSVESSRTDLSSLLHKNREEVRHLVIQKLGKSERDLEEDKGCLRGWFEHQKHLPKVPCDAILEIFLVVNKFNLEKCKIKLSNYYTMRNTIPELYVGKNPKMEHMKLIANVIYIIPLPNLTPSLSRVTIIKLKDINPDNFDAFNFFAHSCNIVEIRIREDMALHDTLIYDLEGVQLGHIFKLRVGAIRKAAKVLENVFSTRLEGIHYINLPSSMQMVLSLVTPMLKEKMRKRIHVHKDVGSLQTHVPKEVLPEDYGGHGASLDFLHGLWLQKLERYQSLFDHLETLVSRNIQSQKEGDDGGPNLLSTFKELSID